MGSIIAPIHLKISKNIENIDFKDFIIRRITQEEKDVFIDRKSIDSFYRAEIKKVEWVLSRKEDTDEDFNIFKNAMICLRRSLIVYRRHSLNLFVFGTADRKKIMISPNRQFHNINDPYEIDDGSFEKIKDLYSKIKKLVLTDKSFEMIIERYEAALSVNTIYQNQFVDFITILESLFIKQNHGEYTFRLSVIVSVLLAAEFGLDKKEVYKNMKKFYGIRSNFVHNGKSKEYQSAYTYELNDFVRMVIWLYVNKKELFENEDIIENLI